MSALGKLPGIGKVLEHELASGGIATPEILRQKGSEAVFLLLKERDPGSCLHKLYALEAAVLGVKKPDIPSKRKAELKAFFDQL